MTVHELIEMLEEFDPDLLVRTQGEDRDDEPVLLPIKGARERRVLDQPERFVEIEAVWFEPIYADECEAAS